MNWPVIGYKVRFICCAIHIQSNDWKLDVDNIVVPFFITYLNNKRKGEKIYLVTAFIQGNDAQIFISIKQMIIFFVLGRKLFVGFHGRKLFVGFHSVYGHILTQVVVVYLKSFLPH